MIYDLFPCCEMFSSSLRWGKRSIAHAAIIFARSVLYRVESDNFVSTFPLKFCTRVSPALCKYAAMFVHSTKFEGFYTAWILSWCVCDSWWWVMQISECIGFLSNETGGDMGCSSKFEQGCVPVVVVVRQPRVDGSIGAVWKVCHMVNSFHPFYFSFRTEWVGESANMTCGRVQLHQSASLSRIPIAAIDWKFLLL